MKKIEKEGLEIELIKDYLSIDEYQAIIANAVESFGEEQYDNISINYIKLEDTFYRGLGLTCIKDFNEELHNKIFEKDMYREITNLIINANKALELSFKSADKVFSIEKIVDKNLKSIVEIISKKIPNTKEMSKLMEKLPSEMKDAFDKYQQITGLEDAK